MDLFKNLGRYGSQTAMLDDKGNHICYQELENFCENLGNIIEERTLVFSFCENSIESISGYISFLNCKTVPLLLDRHIDPSLRENLMKIYHPAYLYLPNDLYESDFKGNTCVWEGKEYCLCRTRYSAKIDLYGELGLLLTTSGSTGSPKLVRQSYENIQRNTESIIEYLKIQQGDRAITTLPMNYTYGLSIIQSHLAKGATLLVTDYTLMQREFWQFFKEEKATTFGGVPYTYEMLKKLRFLRMDLPSLRYMTQAGGKLSPELHREFAEYAKEKGKEFIVMYGQCEATARMAYLPAEFALEKCGSMGIAIPGGRFELVDEAGKVIDKCGVEGELIFYGENVTLGYAECLEDLARGDERQGRLETGDMARRDGDGFYYITGRKKRFLKIFGNRVNLDETERLISGYLRDSQLWNDMECACAGFDDKLYVFLAENGGQADMSEGEKEDTGAAGDCVTKREEESAVGGCMTERVNESAVRDCVAEKEEESAVGGCVAEREDEKELERSLKHFLSDKTGLNPVAFQIKQVAYIPKNEAGKVQYKKLEEFYDGI